MKGRQERLLQVGTAESESLLLCRGKENLSVKMGNINPAIFLSFNNFFPLARLFLLPPCSFP